MTARKPIMVMDTETYRDYFLVAFRRIDSGESRFFEMFDGHPLDFEAIRRALPLYEIVTFNGIRYDLPLLAIALRAAEKEPDKANGIIKAASDAIIKNNLSPRNALARFGGRELPVDHVDLIEVAPGIASLKIYGARMHCPTMQDLPIDPDDEIRPEDRELLRQYCGNDLAVTESLFRALEPQIDLRRELSAQYGVDLRSKSDAQIAETVIVKECTAKLKRAIDRPTIPAGTVFKYQAPDFIAFDSPDLRALLDQIHAADFVVLDTGGIRMPEALAGREIKIGSSVYRMGIGGLHSSEQCAAHVADDSTLILDRDVASYYPSIILRCKLAPAQFGDAFLPVYQSIVDRRLAAKHAGDKVTADVLKIVVNGSFGKFGSKWSDLYAPDLMIRVTVTGQLALLMLIESLEANGIPVVSANTDGVVIKCPAHLEKDCAYLISEWEWATGFVTEETRYSALYSRDVNNYVALKADGKAKLKGAYASGGLSKNPTAQICVDAALAYLARGVPAYDTIRDCDDVRRFLTVRQVRGGAVKDGEYLGRAARWYYSSDCPGPITYRESGAAVARSDDGRPLMTLTDGIPDDLDYSWYIDEARAILSQIGAIANDDLL